jgi:hypothetical protein
MLVEKRSRPAGGSCASGVLSQIMLRRAVFLIVQMVTSR